MKRTRILQQDTRRIMQGAESYYHGGSKKVGCLCLHGFCATPHEVLWLAQHLAQYDYTVLAPRIAGHGTHPRHLATKSWEDWLISALDAYHILRQECEHVVVGGLSMGSLLAINISIEQPVDGVFVLATPLILNKSLPLKMIAVGKYLRRYSDHTDRSDFADSIKRQQAQRGEPVIGRVRYNTWPSSAVHELMKLIDFTRYRLPQVTAPLLSIYSQGDKTVPMSSEAYLREHIRSQEKRHHVLPRSGHVLTQDIAQDEVFNLVADFVRQQTSAL